MKSVTQIRKDLEVLSESVESASEMRKLSTLVRAGLFDANKLTMLKRALNKDNVKMTKAERETLLELLDKLLNLITSNQQVFMKVKQGVSEDVDVLEGSEYQELDESLTGSANDINKIPPLIIMRRRAIRIFPDGQKVALYWADKINKFITVPFESIGISEETQLDEISVSTAQRVYAQRYAQPTDDEVEKEIRDSKAQRTLRRIKSKYGKTAQVRAIAMGKKAEKEREAGEGTFSKISQAAGGGLTGVTAGAAGMLGVGINKLARSGARKVFAKKLSNIREERQQIDEYGIVTTAAKEILKNAPRLYSAGKDFIAKNASGVITAGKETAKKVINKVKGTKTPSAKPPKAGALSAAEKAKMKREKIDKLLNKRGPSRKGRGKAAAAGAAAGAGAGGIASLIGGGIGGGSSSPAPRTDFNRQRYDVDRNVSVNNPYSAYRERKFAQSAVAPVSENALFQKLKTISESNDTYTHMFEDGSVYVTPTLANRLLETYSKLNMKNKVSIREMINKDKSSFIKVANFSVGK